jgi:hypothetical protein
MRLTSLAWVALLTGCGGGVRGDAGSRDVVADTDASSTLDALGEGTSGDASDDGAASEETVTADASDAPDGDAGSPLCGAAPRRYSGPLCGPPTMPCAVLADELLPFGSHYRSGVPSIALDSADIPIILYNDAEGGFHGHVATRTSDTSWSVEDLPFPVARGSLTLLSDGTPLALVEDGASTTSIARRAATGWVAEPVPGVTEVLSPLFRSEHDCLYALIAQSGRVALGVRDETLSWSFTQLSTEFVPNSWLAFSAAGYPSVGFIEENIAMPTLFSLNWLVPPPPASRILSTTELPNDGALAVTGSSGPGTPQFFVSYPNNAPTRLAHTEPAPGGGWTTVEIAQRSFPVTAAASESGDVRMLLSDGPGGSLRIAWRDTATIGVAAVRDGFGTLRGAAAVDTLGRIHLAVYEEWAFTSDAGLRWILLGPADPGCGDVRSDASNCGVCGHACATGERCASGVCTPVGCASGLTACRDDDGVVRCVDLTAEPCHCGECGARCSGTPCSAGTCVFKCGGTPGAATCPPPPVGACISGARPRCTNVLFDPNNCGACGVHCAAGMVCTSGTCR